MRKSVAPSEGLVTLAEKISNSPSVDCRSVDQLDLQNGFLGLGRNMAHGAIEDRFHTFAAGTRKLTSHATCACSLR